jgi:outer membrane lipoprotein-sorting protein
MNSLGLGRYDRKQFLAMAGGAFAVLLLLMGMAGPVRAQDAGAQEAEPNAVTGSAGGNAWQAEVTPSEDGDAASALPDDHIEIVEQINAYLLTFTDVKGQFVQTNPDNAVQKGVFYVKRPGKMRFDYARPSKMRIVSDGSYLSIEDHDLKTVNRYPLESTPFRMLLKDDAKLQRDARILRIVKSDTSIIIALADRSGQSAGQIQLFFSFPDVELKEWIITDAQGLNTRIEVSNLEYDQQLDDKLFAPSNIGLANIFEKN